MKAETLLAQRRAQQMTIPAERFELRPPRRSDAGLISHYVADRRVAENTTSIPHPLPPGVVDAFLTRVTAPERTEDAWVIDASAHDGDEVMGLIGLKRMDRDQSELGYWVAPAFWNAGIASEGVAALVQANPHGARTLFASVFQDNPASARVLIHSGFQYLGDAESYCVARGTTVPTWTYLRRM